MLSHSRLGQIHFNSSLAQQAKKLTKPFSCHGFIHHLYQHFIKRHSGGIYLNSFPLERSVNLSSGVNPGKAEGGRTCSSISSVTSLGMPVQMEYWYMFRDGIMLLKVQTSRISTSLLTLNLHNSHKRSRGVLEDIRTMTAAWLPRGAH